MFTNLKNMRSCLLMTLAFATACGNTDNPCPSNGCLAEQIRLDELFASTASFPLTSVAKIPESASSTCFPRNPGTSWDITKLPWQINIQSGTIVENAALNKGDKPHSLLCPLVVVIENYEAARDSINRHKAKYPDSVFMLTLSLKSSLQNIGYKSTTYTDALILSNESRTDIIVPPGGEISLDMLNWNFSFFQLTLVSSYATSNNTEQENFNIGLAKEINLLSDTVVLLSDIRIVRH